jgi:hypothetical protein
MSDQLVYINSISNSVNISEVGMIFSQDLEYDEWYKLMQTLGRLETAFQFAIGDALNYGMAKYGEKYSNAIDATGFAYQSLANWTWVSKSVSIDNRVSGLSWSHHRAVATCQPSEQQSLLLSAQARGISASDLLLEIQGEPDEKKPSKSITLPPGWTMDDANKALDMISSYSKGLDELSVVMDAVINSTEETKVQRYCDQCPYNN